MEQHPPERLRPLLDHALAARDWGAIFATAAVSLNAQSNPLQLAVLIALRDHPGSVSRGLAEALHLILPAAVIGRLRRMVTSEPAPIAAVVLDVLSTHGQARRSGDRAIEWIDHEDGGIRATAWRILGCIGHRPDRDIYAAAAADPEAGVRLAALETALWHRELWLRDYCRREAAKPRSDNMEAVLIAAILGQPQDLGLMRGIAENSSMGPDRFRILSAYGNPRLAPAFMAGMENADPAVAAAAGSAFETIFGVNVGSGRRVRAESDFGDDPFEAEFVEEINLPDVNRARAFLNSAGLLFTCMERLRRGREPDIHGHGDLIDMEGRRHAFLRARYNEESTGRLTEFESFPQSATPYQDPKRRLPQRK
jgi:hypothetical protein